MKKLAVAAFAVAIAGCSTMQPPRYSVSVDNIQMLKKYDAKAKVVQLNQAAPFDANCRAMGPIEPADGVSIPQFISKAFNDEFKMAGLYSDDGVSIRGEITKVEFSSVSNLTNGYWDLGIKLISSNGKELQVDNTYRFKSGFDAITACNATADALTPAVQDLIKAVVSDPSFGTLLTKG